MKKPTISIGIPAYNEEANIKNLLLNLLDQKANNFVLKEIIVNSDGSTDDTVKIGKSVKDKRIKIISHSRRYGVNKAQNEITRHATGDILVMINADVLPKDFHFLSNLIKPLLKDKNVGIVGANTISLPSRNLLERILANSHEMKQFLYSRISNADNVFLCHGRARALSKELYKQLVWPSDCPEDGYSYFFCKQKGFKFVFSKDASILFRSPARLEGHIRQSNRFFHGLKQLELLFPSDFIKTQLSFPKSLLIKTVLYYLIKNPVSTPAFLLISLYIRFFKNFKPDHFSKYDIVPTSKRIIYET